MFDIIQSSMWWQKAPSYIFYILVWFAVCRTLKTMFEFSVPFPNDFPKEHSLHIFVVGICDRSIDSKNLVYMDLNSESYNTEKCLYLKFKDSIHQNLSFPFWHGSSPSHSYGLMIWFYSLYVRQWRSLLLE